MSHRRPPDARVLETDTPARFEAALEAAVELLRRGELVVLPTETVYGLAGNALHPDAVRRIYAIKGRPSRNPIIVHVVGREMTRRCAADWPDAAARLAAAFWPGPLTLVVRRSPAIPDVVTAGGDTVGLRWPAHPFMQEVIRRCDFPVAAPSANLSNGLSPTCAEHARRSLGRHVPLIVDGGSSQVGIESTVVDVTQPAPRVLRPGMIHLESILAVLGERGPADRPPELAAADLVLRSPGMLARHYSPRARLLVREWRDPDDLQRQLIDAGLNPAGCHVIAHACIPPDDGYGSVRVIPQDPEAYARALYAELHRCDDDGAACIVVEAVPGAAGWDGIADRLRRAASQ